MFILILTAIVLVSSVYNDSTKHSAVDTLDERYRVALEAIYANETYRAFVQERFGDVDTIAVHVSSVLRRSYDPVFRDEILRTFYPDKPAESMRQRHPELITGNLEKEADMQGIVVRDSAGIMIPGLDNGTEQNMSSMLIRFTVIAEFPPATGSYLFAVAGTLFNGHTSMGSGVEFMFYFNENNRLERTIAYRYIE